MTNNIRDRIKDILGRANGYNEGFNEGYSKGVDDTLAALNEFVTAQGAERSVAARRGAPPEQPATPSRRRRKRRGLTPTEARIVDFVTANPGCTMADIDAAGITGRGTLYSLVARRKLMRREDPKPRTYGRPWVHFYPMEPRNDQT